MVFPGAQLTLLGKRHHTIWRAMQYGVLWSLAVEEHFYLLWPAVVHHLSRLNVIVCAGVIAALCLLLRVLYCVLGHPVPGYTWLAADGLAMGAVLAAVARCAIEARRNVRRFTVLAFASSLALFAIGAPFGIFLARHFLGLTLRETALNLFFAGVVGLTLLVGTSKWRGIVNRPVFQFLGEISYGVYLIHMLVFEVAVHFIKHAWPGLPPAASHFSVMMLQFCLNSGMTIGLAVLSRRYFEQPFLNLKDRQKVDLPPLLAEEHKEEDAEWHEVGDVTPITESISELA